MNSFTTTTINISTYSHTYYKPSKEGDWCDQTLNECEYMPVSIAVLAFSEPPAQVHDFNSSSSECAIGKCTGIILFTTCVPDMDIIVKREIQDGNRKRPPFFYVLFKWQCLLWILFVFLPVPMSTITQVCGATTTTDRVENINFFVSRRPKYCYIMASKIHPLFISFSLSFWIKSSINE